VIRAAEAEIDPIGPREIRRNSGEATPGWMGSEEQSMISGPLVENDRKTPKCWEVGNQAELMLVGTIVEPKSGIADF
jgi:hypothetical protein